MKVTITLKNSKTLSHSINIANRVWTKKNLKTGALKQFFDKDDHFFVRLAQNCRKQVKSDVKS